MWRDLILGQRSNPSLAWKKGQSGKKERGKRDVEKGTNGMWKKGRGKRDKWDVEKGTWKKGRGKRDVEKGTWKKGRGKRDVFKINDDYESMNHNTFDWVISYFYGLLPWEIFCNITLLDVL